MHSFRWYLIIAFIFGIVIVLSTPSNDQNWRETETRLGVKLNHRPASNF